MAPATPISTGTGTIRLPLSRPYNPDLPQFSPGNLRALRSMYVNDRDMMRFLERERLRQGEYGEDEAPPLPRLDPRPIRRFSKQTHFSNGLES
jgi:hypothetical protein